MSVRRTVLVVLIAAAAIAAVPGARGDGGPSPGVLQDRAGIADPAAGVRFVALWAGKNTLLTRVKLSNGVIERSRLLRGWYGLPLVTWGGDVGGLSPDRRVLVLGDQAIRQPRTRTRFLVFDTRGLRRQKLIRLRGDFTFDAISPDGSRLYLTEHPAARDTLRYAVREYDLAHGRLLAKPLVDPNEPGMRGSPSARVTSRRGSWVYTLYYGGREPFVHALDTVHGRARCLDFDWHKRDGKIWQMKLRFLDGQRKLGFVNRTTGTAARPTLDLSRLHATDG
jgi:hypothetical protein